MSIQHHPRRLIKWLLASAGSSEAETGASLLIYHRIGAGTRDELDVPTAAFIAQLDVLSEHDIVGLDTALDRLDGGASEHSIVLTFDDGFADVYENAWPHLRDRHLPFTVYLASAYMGEQMVWEGSSAKGARGMGVTWHQLEEMLDSGLCTIGNHTHTHVRPEELTTAELDECNEVIERHLGVRPAHFTYPWGVPVPALEQELALRFRSSSTGLLGRNGPETHRQRLRRIPVRQSDPQRFFEAKLQGDLRGERAYERIVHSTKALLRGISG
ncbi:MAG TPA: polysaccharide deacetylase family protein [Intrasporangiaceae bacterium]|nr:polysaccharide deacetylase family protein [Intrasporangiaceae bacterium]